MHYSQIVKEHVPVGGFITYPNIQISTLGDRDTGIAEIIQRAGCTDHDGPALGIAADVFELFIQQDPVQVGLGLARRVGIVTREKAVQRGIDGAGGGIVQVGERSLGSAAGTHNAGGKGSQHIGERAAGGTGAGRS